jgi:hypothetical protein
VTSLSDGYFSRFFEFRLVPNAPSHQGPADPVAAAGIGSFELAIIEFDDQGICFDRGESGLGAKLAEAIARDFGSIECTKCDWSFRPLMTNCVRSEPRIII